jgi:hypothetical protein
MLTSRAKYSLIIIILLWIQSGYADEQKTLKNDLYDQYPWNTTLFYGVTASDALARLAKGVFHRWPEQGESIEISRTLDENNFLRRLVHPLVWVVHFSVDFMVRYGDNEHTIYEVDPYLCFRWVNFPWDKYVNTSLAIGEGVSYDSSVPSLEKRTNENTKRLLNFLMLEATFASPLYPRTQLVIRVHHRSGAYGLYHAGNTGSNVVGAGVRFLL